MPPPTYASRLQWLSRYTSTKAPRKFLYPKPLHPKPKYNRSTRQKPDAEAGTSPPPRFLSSARLWRLRKQWREVTGQLDPKHRRVIWKLAWMSLYIPILYVVDRHMITLMHVTGPSMTPTLNANYKRDEPNTQDLVLVNLHDAGRKARRGDVIVFRSPKDPERCIIKRIAAVQGDIVHPLPPYPTDPIIVPWGQLWVEGDTEDKSQTVDSNTFGLLPRTLVLGRVMTVVWPFNQIGKIVSKDSARVIEGAVKLKDPNDVLAERETYWKSLKDKITREKNEGEKPGLADGEAELAAIRDIESA